MNTYNFLPQSAGNIKREETLRLIIAIGCIIAVSFQVKPQKQAFAFYSRKTKLVPRYVCTMTLFNEDKDRPEVSFSDFL